MEPEPTIFVVDDEEVVRDWFAVMLRNAGLRFALYPSADEFLHAFDSELPGCLVLDISLPGMNGLELQELLVSRGALVPIVIVTGHGDVPLAVQAMKRGAFDFIEKPLRHQEILQAIRRALAHDAEQRQAQARRRTTQARLAMLTAREREVMNRLVEGDTTEQIAATLDLSPKTVYVHRAHIMQKLHVESLAELVRVAMESREQ